MVSMIEAQDQPNCLTPGRLGLLNAAVTPKEVSSPRKADGAGTYHWRQRSLAVFREHIVVGEVLGVPATDSRRIWGDPINPLDALADFDRNTFTMVLWADPDIAREPVQQDLHTEDIEPIHECPVCLHVEAAAAAWDGCHHACCPSVLSFGGTQSA
jgi:hypothetical protein